GYPRGPLRESVPLHRLRAYRARRPGGRPHQGCSVMKMHILSGGRVRMRKSIYLPDADRSKTIELPVSSILLRDARGNVLFDTGCHPSVVEDAPARWGGLAKLITPIMGANDNVLAGLATLGLEPGDIDLVVCSHLHPDHCGCNEFFTRATVM